MHPLKRVKNSIESRLIHPWTIKHFSMTRYGKRISAYKGAYAGQKCFFVGNGPSLTAEDLTAIYNRGIPSFGFNRIYYIFEKTLWRPTFYISQDEKMLSGCIEEVNNLELNSKWIPIQLKLFNNLKVKEAIYFNLLSQNTDLPERFHFSNDAANQIFNSETVMYTAAQLASYMGFKEIYLIGVDHHFHISKNNRGEVVVDASVKDYFSENYNSDKENLYIPNTEKSTLSYIAMKKHCEDRGIRVFNATRGGCLEVFDRVDFDNII